jgi:hypothetical protein
VLDASKDERLDGSFTAVIDVGNLTFKVEFNYHGDGDIVEELGAHLRRITNLKARIRELRETNSLGGNPLDNPSIKLKIQELETDLCTEYADLRGTLSLVIRIAAVEERASPVH